MKTPDTPYKFVQDQIISNGIRDASDNAVKACMRICIILGVDQRVLKEMEKLFSRNWPS